MKNNENQGVEEAEGVSASKEKMTPAKLIAPAILVLALILGWQMGWFEYFSLENLIIHQARLNEMVMANPLYYAFMFMIIYALLVAISFPGASLLTVVGGLLFGGFWGGVLAIIGATAGAIVIFWVARSSFGGFLEKKAGKFVGKMIKGIKEDAFNYLLFLRLTPVFPFWVVNIVPGLLNMKLSTYSVATMLGIIPGTFAYSFVGASLVSILQAQEKANPGCTQTGKCPIELNALVTPELVFAMIALAVISVLPVALKKLRANRRNNEQNGK